MEHRKRIYTQLHQIPGIKRLSKDERFDTEVVSKVLPFRTNNYIVDELIDWQKAPNDPIYRMNFMHRDMLDPADFKKVAKALKKKESEKDLERIVHRIRMKLNPHPAGQLTLNIPCMFGKPVPGIQHKYRETCLVFPYQGQSCLAYCTFCFRWPQFVGINEYKFATQRDGSYRRYIRRHHEITDVLITGGDPMIMNARMLASYLLTLLDKKYNHVRNIRIGTKVLSHWPYRFLTDPDSEDLLYLFRRIRRSGKHLSFMAHFSHPIELSTKVVQNAIRRIRSTGAEIRTQSPLLRNINDSSTAWSDMWCKQVELGMVPYYMFVERNTGAKRYFALPLSKALEIYQGAIKSVSGLARTVRGPSMSAVPGKVCIEGVTRVHGEKVFVLSFLQGRNSDWVKRPFFAKYNEKSTWLNELQPAFGAKQFFYEPEFKRLCPYNAED